MRIRKLLALLLAAAAALCLPACGGSTSGSNAGKTADESKTEITAWAWDDNFNVKALRLAKERYEAEHPDVTLTVISQSLNDVVQKLNTAFAAESYDGLPNIVLIEDYRVGGYLDVFPGSLRDLSSIINADDWMPYKLSAFTRDGKIYGVPFDSAVCGMFYRVDFLEQAGYTGEDLNNITWSEYIALGKNVKEATGVSMLEQTSGDLTLMKILMQSAGTWYVSEDNTSLNIAGNPVIKEAMQVYKDLMDAGIVMNFPGWDEKVRGIQNGDLATIVDGCWISATIKTAEDQSGKWALKPIPRMDHVEGAVNASNVGGSSWYVVDKVANADVAENFLKETFASDTGFLNELVNDIGLFSSHKSDGNFTNYEAQDAFFGNQKIWEDFAAWAELVPQVPYGINTYNIDDIVEEELQTVLQGGDIDAALSAIESRAAQIGQIG